MTAAEHLVLEAGQSGELRAQLQLIAEAGSGGAPKYAPQTVRALARLIACRSYAGAVLELCHLLRMADAAGDYVSFFFMPDVARASVFAQALKPLSAQPTRFRPDRQGVALLYDDQPFLVSYGRMPVLAALAEFLIGTVGFADLDDAVQALRKAPFTAAAAGQAANSLSRRVYDYLKDHLPSAQHQRVFQTLIGWLRGREAEVDLEGIDDSAVLDFWIAANRPQDAADVSEDIDFRATDFRTFNSVMKAFLRLRQAMELGRERAAERYARSIGFDREAGEVDPAAIDAALTEIDARESPLDALSVPPASRIKFLNKKETGVLALYAECGEAVLKLPLSFLRAECFGQGQMRITQALRRKDTAALGSLVDAASPQDYGDTIAGLEALGLHLDRVLRASFFVLAGARRPEAVEAVLATAPDLDLSPLRSMVPEAAMADSGDNVVMLTAKSVSEHFITRLEDPALGGDDLSAFMRDARKAFQGISRQGFAEAAPGPDIVEGFAAAAPLLASLKAEVATLREALVRLPDRAADLNGQYARDREVFRGVFGVIYGAYLKGAG